MENLKPFPSLRIVRYAAGWKIHSEAAHHHIVLAVSIMDPTSSIGEITQPAWMNAVTSKLAKTHSNVDEASTATNQLLSCCYIFALLSEIDGVPHGNMYQRVYNTLAGKISTHTTHQFHSEGNGFIVVCCVVSGQSEDILNNVLKGA